MAKKRTTKSTETPDEIARSIFAESLDAIRTEIRGIVKGTIKPEGHDSASRISWLAKNAASVSAELRKAEKAHHDSNAETTVKQVVEFVRRASDAERRQVMRAVRDAQDGAGKSGLA